MNKTLAAAGAALTLAAFAAISAAEARPAAMAHACSRYGSGCISAPIRRAASGGEVRLPGGTWIGCRRDCSETLRQETVDFWVTKDANGGRKR